MLNFFESIVTWISTIASLILNAITSLVELVQLVLASFQSVSLLFVLLPSVLSASFFLIVAICIIKLVIGR